ncbi:pseudouridine synthase [Sphingomonas sp.]|uniref:pseudouridine synthase n=1 Tax=Sphingomonas sp. TaxID=28214 RepID=UPI002CE5668A|nr:pseudouridine synthase [Sphingomonas sp.]HWK36018.1 pseudouridine synthase [Sphingomonas sp.]
MSKTIAKDSQRIAKLLARAGVASRREIERMIAEGRVALNGTAIDTPATLLTSLHGVTVDGAPVSEPAPARLFLFHKPTGVLTAANDPKGRATIYDKLPADLPRVIPVGRLDLNTEGLLLLTTDGEFKRQLELPATGVERSYRARAYGQVTQAQLEDLIDGIEIEGVRYGQIDANLERRTGANVWIEMTLREGKNREVRRVLEHLGLRVSRLIRTRYGPFVLGDMPVGAVGEVRQHDLVAFRQSLGRKGAVQAPVTVNTAPKPAVARAVAQATVRAARAGPERKHPVREEIDTRRPRPNAAPRGKPAGSPGQRALAAAAPRTRPDGKPPARAPQRRAPPPEKPKATDATLDAATERPARPQRKPGWARAKPKPGTKPRGRRK